MLPPQPWPLCRQSDALAQGGGGQLAPALRWVPAQSQQHWQGLRAVVGKGCFAQHCRRGNGVLRLRTPHSHPSEPCCPSPRGQRYHSFMNPRQQ